MQAPPQQYVFNRFMLKVQRRKWTSKMRHSIYFFLTLFLLCFILIGAWARSTGGSDGPCPPGWFSRPGAESGEAPSFDRQCEHAGLGRP